MKLQDYVEKAIRVSHRGRCLLVGCYYGLAGVDTCIYCGTPRPGTMPIEGGGAIDALQPQLPESPDFDEIARLLAITHAERQNLDGLDEHTQTLEADIAEQLRLAWNARGAVDMATLATAYRADSPPPIKTIDGALRTLDR